MIDGSWTIHPLGHLALEKNWTVRPLDISPFGHLALVLIIIINNILICFIIYYKQQSQPHIHTIKMHNIEYLQVTIGLHYSVQRVSINHELYFHVIKYTCIWIIAVDVLHI